MNSLTQNYPNLKIKHIIHKFKLVSPNGGMQDGSVLNASLISVNAASHSLYKWNRTSLVKSEDNDLAIFLKALITFR